MDDRPPDDVLAYYESGGERRRLDTPLGEVELLRTQEILLRYLRPSSDVLDVGGGTGVYAEWLAALGHRVRLVDPVPLHLREAQQRAADGAPFEVEQGDARRLGVADESFDCVLLLGPLYHLSRRDHRLRSLAEARRACRSGGIVAAAAISRFAPLLDMLARRGLEDDRVRANVADELERGARVAPSRRTSPFPNAYFHRVEELAEEIVDAGLTLEAIFGVEGPAALLVDLERRWSDTVARERVLWAARQLETEASVLGVSSHLLAIARRS
jgi:SAM-dependent methyltransferase